MAEGAAKVRVVTAAEFSRLLRPLLRAAGSAKLPPRIAVAVSGGADSLALALLAAGFARTNAIALEALIVDHRLRPESSREARQVARWLKQAGIACRILTWKRAARPSANRQAAAREARYALLRDHCRRRKIRHLLLAHHRDDQAETFLLRALRGSGVDGLAGMAPARVLAADFVLLRPLLDIPKARLVATLRKRGQDWIEDPSNSDPSYARVRVRQALRLLAGEDGAQQAVLATHLAQTARNLARARAALHTAAYDALRAAATLHPAGFAWLDPAPLRQVADETALRALARLLMAIGGQDLPPRLERLERLWERLAAGLATPHSLHRCSLRPPAQGADGPILVCREARHLPLPQPLRKSLLWDGRFQVTVAGRSAAGLMLAPLGAARPAMPDAAAAGIPRPAWPALPALWQKNRLVAVPFLALGAMPRGVAFAFHPAIAEKPGGENL
ncbi:MAG TPA: tRNA lysidine(34) synthetase TilS [Alphaproteobacteria bacterium]